jgi:hypothetical protein
VSRISELRRRDWTTDDPQAIEELSAALNPSGRGTFRLIQAIGIRECLRLGGVLLAARVGAGKTLTAGALATLYEDMRPLVVVPGGHQDKTEHEFAGYRAEGWELSHKIHVITYNDIARDVDEKLLRAYHPNVLICDEVDKLRRVQKGGSGTAARIAEWMAAYPQTIFAGMSGTMFKEGLQDYAHLLNWALKENAPCPQLQGEIAQWHKGLKNVGSRHVQNKICAQLGVPPGSDVRKAYRERLWYSPGVIISVDCFSGVPLTIETRSFDPGTQDILATLYETGETPDGLDVMLGGEDSEAEGIGTTWAAERQIALGFYYKPAPTPPIDWARARRKYFRWVRSRILAGQFKTELQARRWAKANDVEAWVAWEQIEPTFEPRFVPVWINDRAINFCKQWGQGGGIVWTDHRAFAERLSAECGWRWFAAGGRDASGLMIEKCTDRTIIASRQANGTGRNLQRWNRGLITAMPGNGRDAEQLFGRQHREGQDRAVEMQILFACRAHANDLRKVMSLSQEEAEEMGRKNKILTASWR